MSSAAPCANRFHLRMWEQPRKTRMSWVELERLVEDAEGKAEIRAVLRTCQTQPQLVLMARQLGYHITRVDLARAWENHQATSGQRASGS